MKNKRLFYFFATSVLFLIEVLIALFVRDQIVRPYVGDVLVTMLVFCFVRMLIPVGIRLLPLYVFVFACAVEFLQYLNFVEIIGLADNQIAKTVIGSSFSWIDIICYGIGCVACWIFQKHILCNCNKFNFKIGKNMNSLNPLKIGKYTFWISFGIGNFFFWGFIICELCKYTEIADFFGIAGMYYIPIAFVINLLILIFLQGYGRHYKERECMIGSAILFINVPVAILYAFIGFCIVLDGFLKNLN